MATIDRRRFVVVEEFVVVGADALHARAELPRLLEVEPVLRRVPGAGGVDWVLGPTDLHEELDWTVVLR